MLDNNGEYENQPSDPEEDRSNEDWSEVDQEQLRIGAVEAVMTIIAAQTSGTTMSRKVMRTDLKERDIFVSTIYAQDIEKYETAVHHPLYCNRGELIIADYYDSEEEARRGHLRWEEALCGEEPTPERIRNVQTGVIYNRKEV